MHKIGWQEGEWRKRRHPLVGADVAFPWPLEPQTATRLLHRPRAVENPAFRVRDVTPDEERLHSGRYSA